MGKPGLIIAQIRKYWFYYLLAALSITLANMVHALYPAVLGDFADQVEAAGLTAEAVRRSSLELLAIGAGYCVLFGVGQYINHRLGRYFEFATRQKLFRHFTGLSEAWFSKNGIGKLLSYVMNDVTTVRESIANGLNQLTNAVVLLCSSVTIMLLSGIPLHVLAVSILPLGAIPFLVVWFGPRIRNQSLKVQESLAAMTESAEEQFGGIKVTKTFAAEDVARSRFGETVDRIRENQYKLVRLSGKFQASLPLAGAMALVVAMTWGGVLVLQGRLSLGHFVELTLYLRMIANPLQQIGNVINMVQRARASLERLNRLLAIRPDIADAEGARPLPKNAAAIEIRGLTFTYPGAGRPALSDITLDIKPGMTVGIVGRTGSGKTTLVKLLLRVYDPPRGSVFIAGQDIREATLESLRTVIGYVPQDGFLFSTTIADNIAFHNRAESRERIEDAARLADIYDNIAGFPDGFDTKLGERGLTLSGGQRQRTSLARGLIKEAPILILDDSVSAVDTVTESRILHNLRKTRRGKTTLMIAHRISAVMHADLIVVMDGGRIVERGTHRELMRMGGHYAAMARLQGEEAVVHG
ncbi:ABC-type multidrug transport system, ATPase and permease component [Thermobacillus composti KWC4]|uniref:ABC-type multidrug transport system, ATPase and permease component n=1 Tax=Thermobacillus composti (strain DSM 18247 / JCM 13945 / KWC4) TaxID=717605 RepID=L0EHS2_THECK|nr:ABC transporter ATP-binding protein [Thermobacillus composti]AGA59327.1 ABC-type multidrug transport system, ATPase and permease component [Thermobacillus composti KWC4]